MLDALMDHNKVLIVSDLDGTLLDHHNYSFQAAKPMLDALIHAQVPIILNTSKTFAEVACIRHDLKITSPFIVENGAAIYIPKNTFERQPNDTEARHEYYIKRFASPRSHWLSVIAELEKDFKGQFEGFSQMSVNRIAEVTGLSHKQAEDAAKREFGEPLLWHGSEQQQSVFIQRSIERGASPLLGGRFLHICGESNKGEAMTWLRDEYARQWQHKDIKTIALGDGNNDIAMLEAADLAVKVRSPVNPPPLLRRKDGVITTRFIGPKGWQDTLASLLPSLGVKLQER